MATGGLISGIRRETRGGLVVLVVLALSPACGSGPSGLGKDANVSASGWEMVVHPGSDVYKAVWLDPPGTVYALANDDPNEDNGTSYSVTSSHDDGKTWTTVPLTDERSPLLSIAAVGPTDVYAVGFTYNYADLINSPALVAKSTDRGATFKLLHPTFAGAFSAVAADGAGNPIGVGNASDGGFFVRSTDGGAAWSRVPVPGTEALWGLWTTASGLIYACGQATSPAMPPGNDLDGGSTDGGTGTVDGGTVSKPAGVVVRSDDGGNTWTTLTTALAPLFALSGTADGQRIIAVGAGFTEIESSDAGATWQVDCSNPEATGAYSGYGSVWVQDSHSAFIAAGNAPYVVRAVNCAYFHGQYSGPEYGSEELPSAGPGGLQSGAVAVAGNSPTYVWAVGAGIFRRR